VYVVVRASVELCSGVASTLAARYSHYQLHVACEFMVA
jgi:hypothetical protein